MIRRQEISLEGRGKWLKTMLIKGIWNMNFNRTRKKLTG